MRNSALLLLLSTAISGCGILTTNLSGGGSSHVDGIQDATADDPAPIRNVSDNLKKYEEGLAGMEAGRVQAKEVERLASDRKHLESEVYVALVSDEKLRTHPRLASLRAKLQTLDAKLATLGGEKSKALWGDGARSSTIKPEAWEVFDQLDRCPGVLKEGGGDRVLQARQEAKDKCDTLIGRLSKIDPGAVRFRGELSGHHSGHFDNLSRSLWVFAMMQQGDQDAEDEYWRAEAKQESYIGCGAVPVTFQALKTGANTYGSWERQGNGFTHAIDCKKMPRASNLPADLMNAVKQDMRGAEGEQLNVYTMDGAISVAQYGLEIYRIATITVSNPKWELPKSPCGDSEKKVVCEASGSRSVGLLNHVEHYLKRADFRKGRKNVDRCKNLSKEAHASAQQLDDFFKKATRANTWEPGLTYLLRSGERIDDKTMKDRIAKAVKDAEDKSLPQWCEGGV